MTPILRAATAIDAPGMAAVQRRAALTAYAHIFPTHAPQPTLELLSALWQQRLTAPGNHGVAAVDPDGDRIVGTVLAGPDEDTANGLLSALYVDPDRWRQGIGRRLYSAAVDALRKGGYRVALLWVLRENDRARRMYESYGWVPDGAITTPFPAVPEVTELRYRLTLAAAAGTTGPAPRPAPPPRDPG